MLSGTFIAEIGKNNTIEIPSDMAKRLQLQDGEKVEVLVKRIRSKRFNIKISQNPLVKLFDLSGAN